MAADSKALTEVAATWFVRRLEGGLSAAERLAFEQWLDQDPRHAVAFARLEATWERAGRLTADGGAPPRPAPLLDRRLAASLFAAVAAGGAGLVLADRGQRYRTAIGERRAWRLADGSRITLNTASELSVRLGARRREVRLLSGEALFEVAHDPARPFVVTTGQVAVRAVGTAFNVRRRGALAEVTVTEGIVAVDPSGAAPLARLRAGQAAVAGPGAVSELALDGEGVQARTAWRRGIIELRGETLAAAVEEFNRYSDHKLAVADPSLADIRVGGAFGTTEADKFVTALELGFPVAARRDPDGVTRLIRRD